MGHVESRSPIPLCVQKGSERVGVSLGPQAAGRQAGFHFGLLIPSQSSCPAPRSLLCPHSGDSGETTFC